MGSYRVLCVHPNGLQKWTLEISYRRNIFGDIPIVHYTRCNLKPEGYNAPRPNSHLSRMSEEIVEAANIAISNLLPTKSRSLYDIAYNRFKEWCAEKNVQVYSENVLLANFSENAKNYKSSTLWAQYSMVKSCLIIYDDIDISEFPKLIAFLKEPVGLILGIAGACRTDELVNLTVMILRMSALP
ncbi:hypothetical protein NQ317_003606 [Molorchus minor]|uniref:Uncharacterized protein n=1 Tax=Molorchus minor TaxID=1323400 RepID=A0ABQ9IXY8_9CUCU|nr:hypothetical protein NQ317_003606 [Molorchus minor]